MPKRLRIAEQWDDFARALELHKTSPVQRQEMRRAFYGGAWALYNLQMNEVSVHGDDATPEDLQMMADLDQELREFAENVKGGRA